MSAVVNLEAMRSVNMVEDERTVSPEKLRVLSILSGGKLVIASSTSHQRRGR
jgi:hypothetical protein